MKLKHIILCTVGLLVAGIGYASADPGAGSRKKVRESSAVRLLADKKRDSDGRISIRCTVARCDTATVLQARISERKHRSAGRKAGLRLVLQNGESLILAPEHKTTCCDDWAAGRWNNVSFRLSGSETGLLKEYDIVSIVISTGKEGDIERNIDLKKQGAIARLIRSIE